MLPDVKPERVLVYVGQDFVGDGLVKLPFVRALRSAYPEAQIIWLAGKGKSAYRTVLAPLVEGLLDIVIDEAEIGSKLAELIMPRPLASQHFDLVIDTQRRVLTTLILRRLRCDRFVSGAANFLFSDRKPPPGRAQPASVVGQLLELVELASGAPAQALAPLSIDEQARADAEALLPAGHVYVGLAPGAGGKHKCWPINEFVGLARILEKNGRVPVFLLGPDEQELHQPLVGAGATARFPLQTPIGRHYKMAPHFTVALGQRLHAAVANDAGGGHILAAAGTPLVSLFGPTDPTKWGPSAPVLEILRAQDWGGDAMHLIPQRAVLQTVEAMLRKSGRR